MFLRKKEPQFRITVLNLNNKKKAQRWHGKLFLEQHSYETTNQALFMP